MRIAILFASLFLMLQTSFTATAQKKLALYRMGKEKVIYFHIGEELTFKLEGEDIYQTFKIKDFWPEQNRIVFEGIEDIPLENIIGLKTYFNRGWSQSFGANLMWFGTSAGLYGLIDLAFGGTFTMFTGILVGSGIVGGWLIQKIFKSKRHKIGDRKVLRIVDLTIVPGAP